MSTFEDIETQNARRPRARNDRIDLHLLTMTSAQYLIALGRDVRDAFNMHVLQASAEPAPSRKARTSLPLLGPWAPPSSAAFVRLRYHDGTEQDVPSSEVTAGEWILYLPGGATARLYSAPTAVGKRGQ